MDGSAEKVPVDGRPLLPSPPSHRKLSADTLWTRSFLVDGRPSMAVGWCLHRLLRRKNPQEKFDALTVDGRVLCYGRLPNEGKKYMGC
jgi:hypothetical protein